MFCKYCGKEIPEETKFCPECGVNQTERVFSESNCKTEPDSFNFHQWIVDNDLQSYEDMLKKQDLDQEDILAGLTASDINNLGIESLGGQKKLLNAISKLNSFNGTNTYTATKEQVGESSDIPNRCPHCGEIWGKDKENTGAGDTLGKAFLGGLLLGPIGVVGGAAFGNKMIVYSCRKCGFKKEYKSSIIKGAAKGIKNIFK